MSQARNVLGSPLQVCSVEPLTGFTRDGVCHTGPQDIGSHTVCAQMTETFLEYWRRRGNDLVSPAGGFWSTLFHSRRWKEDKDQATARVMETLQFIGLANKAFHFVSTLSQAEQKRLSIGVALISQPKMILWTNRPAA